MILEDSRFVTPGSLPPFATTSSEMEGLSAENNGGESCALTPLRESERNLLQQAIEKTDGNQTQAAKLLQITRDTMRYKLKKHGLS